MIDRAEFLRRKRDLPLLLLLLLHHVSYVVCIIHRLAGEQLDERGGADEFVNGARLYLHGSSMELLLVAGRWTNKLGGPFLRVIKCFPRGDAGNTRLTFKWNSRNSISPVDKLKRTPSHT